MRFETPTPRVILQQQVPNLRGAPTTNIHVPHQVPSVGNPLLEEQNVQPIVQQLDKEIPMNLSQPHRSGRVVK